MTLVDRYTEGPTAVADTPASPASPSPANTNIGFLAILQDPGGVLGGYLVTNAWGRPLEFRLTTAVQPNRVQQALYGPTLTEYLHAELIGKSLVEKTATQPGLIVTDSLPALVLPGQVNIPVIAIVPGGLVPADGQSELVPFSHPRSSLPLAYSSRFVTDRQFLDAKLEQIDPAVDLAEPFTRIREAVAEARKMGANSRAA